MPFIASFHPKLSFYKKWPNFLKANLVVTTFFLIWDELFTRAGVWGFNPDYLTGLYIGHMPIEEVLFFICIPYACVFTYHCFQILLPKFRLMPSFSSKLTLVLILLLSISAVLFYTKSYTFYTSIFTAAFLGLCLFLKVDLSKLYPAYVAVIPFFWLSNGYLTGSFTPEPIVWYNNEENLSIRTWTIPAEDYVYGFLMVAANIVIAYWDELKAKK